MMKKTLLGALIAGLMLVSIFSACFTTKAADCEEQHISQSITSNNNFPTTKKESCYGFIIDSPYLYYRPYWENSISCLVNDLLQKNLDIYWLTSDHSEVLIQELNNACPVERDFKKGSFLLPFSDEPAVNAKIQSTLYSYSYNIYPYIIFKLLEPLNDLVYKLVKPKIAIHEGTGDPIQGVDSLCYSECLKLGGFTDVTYLDWDEIPEKLNNEDFNVFIWGGKSGPLNVGNEKWKRAVDKVTDFIKEGGGYVGSCLGGFVASKGILLPEDTLSSLFDQFLPDYFIGADFLTWYALPGSGPINIKVSDENNPVTYGVEPITEQCLFDGPVFYNLGNDTKKILEYKDVTNPYFNWNEAIPEGIKNIWKDFTYGKASTIEAKIGKGKIVAHGTHPELRIPISGEQEESCQIVYNSVFYVISEGPYDKQFSVTVDLNAIDVDAYGPYEGYIGEPISFKGSASNGEPPYEWLWDFGDGVVSTEQNPIHSFEKPGYGVYMVILSVVDNNNNIDTDVAVVNIHNQLHIYMCDGDVDADGAIIEAKKGVKQEYCAYVLGGYGPFYYSWDFNINDNIKADSALGHTSYSYDKTGVFHGTITASDKHGASNTSSFIVIVNSVITDFTAKFTVTPYPSNVKQGVNFDMYVDIIRTPNPQSTYTWILSYGDGTPDDKGSFKADELFDDKFVGSRYHKYSSVGTYHALYTVSDDRGNIYYYMNSVLIDNIGPPDAPSKLNGPTSGKVDEVLIFTTSTTDPDGDLIKYELSIEPALNINLDEWYWASFKESYESGELATFLIVISKQGSYTIKVRAEDIKLGQEDNPGYKSDWSEPSTVTISKNKDDNVDEQDYGSQQETDLNIQNNQQSSSSSSIQQSTTTTTTSSSASSSTVIQTTSNSLAVSSSSTAISTSTTSYNSPTTTASTSVSKPNSFD